MGEFAARAKIAAPCRASRSYRAGNGTLAGAWFMVLLQRGPVGECSFDVSINCYNEFPPVRVVVKQEDLITEVIREYSFELIDDAGQYVNRALTVDDLRFRLIPAGDTSIFNINEAFEAHFTVVDSTPFCEFSTKGFYRDIAVCEREIRREMKDRYRQIGLDDTGEAIDVTIDKIKDGGRYSGMTIISNDEFIVLEYARDIISIHRKVKLDKLPAVGEKATIRYAGKKGKLL